MDEASPTSGWLNIILFLPLGAALAVLLGHRFLKGASVIISVGSSLICLIVSLILLGSVKAGPFFIAPFIHVGGLDAPLEAVTDQQSVGMLFIVTFIGFLVHVFSIGYMKDDPAKPRYFGSLSMFMFSMTGIVLAGNLVMMFIFWELVGLSSYLLIGHWYEKHSACEAAKKAFLTNRIGDFGFMIGILILFALNHGDLTFDGLRDSLAGGTLKGATSTQPGLITAAAICIFMGAVGKSAQFPLHVWLPDAMEGPTPVSALIHAATMVAAGVYMLVRVDFLIGASVTAQQVIAGIGGITALLAALMATQQNDIKRVLAYSTLSQLGYMVMAVGLLAGHAAMFHLYTHAFFKALLFLGSGAVIYACHHEQDIWKMGGLRRNTPVTFWTFLAGTAALIGVPGLSGFLSKEEILGAAFEHCKILFTVAALTAALTAFYMTRLFIVAFLGKARTEAAGHAHDPPLKMLAPLCILAVFSVLSGYGLLAGPLKALKPLHHGDHGHTVMIVSVLALAAGVLLAVKLYKGRDSDPLSIRLFANKFYFDEIYASLVKNLQDRLAWLVTGLERVFVDGLVARLPAAIACKIGAFARSLQAGGLQGYNFLLGLGLLVVVYLVVFVFPRAGH